MIKKFFGNLKINRVARYFIYADLLLFSGWGLVSPIFSIFVREQIPGATLVTVGTGATIYWITRSSIQIPLGNYLDQAKKDTTALYTLLLGLSLAGTAAFFFIFVNSVQAFFLAQFIHGLGMSCYATAWSGVFTKHMDKDKISLEWAIDSSALGFAAGITGFLGGYIANLFGYHYIFAAAGILSFASAFVVFMVPSLVLPTKTTAPKLETAHTPKP